MLSCNSYLLRRLEAPNPGRLRDAQDCEDWAETDVSRLRALKRKFGHAVASLVDRFDVESLIDAGFGRVDPSVVGARLAGAINGNGNGNGNGKSTMNRPKSAYGPAYGRDPYSADRCAPYSGNSVHEGDPGCPERQVCGEDSWPIRSRGVAGFPLIGAPPFAQADLFARPTQNSLVPTFFWMSVKDSAIAGWPRIQGELVNVSIGNTTQFLGSGQDTQIYQDICTRVPVQWDRIEASIGATFTVGHPYANTVEAQFYLTVFGFPNN